MGPLFQWIIGITGIIFNTAASTGNNNSAIEISMVNANTIIPITGNSSLKKIPPKITFDPIVTTDSASCTIPFSRAGNLILIKAKADTIEGSFILDTGAPHLILNTTYFRNYPASGPVNDDPGGITGSVASFSPTSISQLSFGPIKYYNVAADRINLGHIENSKGIKIFGLLGLQLFRQFEMIIDYEKNVIHLHLITKKERNILFHNPLLNDTTLYSITPISIMEDKLLTRCTMAGKKLTFVIDTGAESNVMDSRLPNKIFDNVSITRRIMLAGTGNNKVEALYGYIKNMKIGSQDITTLPVIVTNLEKMCYSYNRCIDGMLGFDFLSLQKIGFNFVSHKMYIWK
ncbi:MAG: aspartyl protease family protein [Ferruginibacter sp.]|nr:aspartyl protease family protein [Ferruginibacter sp.]